MRLRAFAFTVHRVGWLTTSPDAGFTPLHYAAGEGNMQITKYLVEACECDPEFPDNLGLTPGFCAVLQGRKEVAEYLLQV